MPMVVAFLASGTLLANLVLGAASLAVQYGLSYIQKQKAKKAARRATSGRDVQQNIRQSTFPRYIVLGLARVGGVVWFYEAKDKNLYIATILSDDIIDQVSSFYVRNVEVLTSKSGNIYTVTTPPFNTTTGSYVSFEVKFGAIDQSRSELLAAAFPAAVTVNHRAAGVSYMVTKLLQPVEADFQKVFGGAVPEIAALVRGVRIWDGRDLTQNPGLSATWKFSANPALALLHYMTAKNGMGLNRAIFDGDTIIAVANFCDALIQTKTKGLRKRYELGAVISYEAEPADVIEDILNTFAGEIYITGSGLFGLTCDELDVPTITITQDKILEIDAKRLTGALFEASSIKSKFSSEDHGYVENIEEAQQWIDAGTLARIGRDIPHEHELPYVFRHDQARRLMKKKFYDLNPEWTVEFSMDFYGLELFGERVFRLVYPLLGIDQTFRIESLNDEGLLSKFVVKAVSVSPLSTQWNYLTEEGTAPAIAPATSEDSSPQTPTGLSVLAGNPGTPRALVYWSAPPTGKVSEAQYKLTTDTDWTTVAVPATSNHAITLSPLTLAANYDFRVRFSDAAIGVSAWATITFAANPIAGTTAALTSLTAFGGVLNLTATVVQSSAAPAAYVEITKVSTGAAVSWAGSVTKPVGASGSVTEILGVVNPGVYDIYARSIGINGDLGAVTGPVSATATQFVSTTGTTGSSAGGGTGNSEGLAGFNTGSGGGLPPGGIYGGNSTPSDGASGGGLY